MINQPDLRTTDYSQPRETINPGMAGASMRSATTDGSYEESRHANYVDPADNGVEDQREVYQDKNLRREDIHYWVAIIFHSFLGVVEIILALRFLYRLLGRRSSNAVSGHIVIKTDAH